MRTRLLQAVAGALLLTGIPAVAAADESVVLACSVNVLPLPEFQLPPVSVTACDKSAGVPIACPPGFSGVPGDPVASCAQTLASFLSLSGYKLANVQAGQGGPVYTIVGPQRARQD